MSEQATGGGAGFRVDEELDGREGQRQSNPETKRLAQAGIDKLTKACQRKIAEGDWGKLSLTFTWVDGQIVDFEVGETTTGVAAKKRRQSRDQE